VQATRWSSAGAGNTLIEGPRLSAVLDRASGLVARRAAHLPLYICQVPETSLFERYTLRTCVLGCSHRGGPEAAPLPIHYKLQTSVLSVPTSPTHPRIFRTHVPHAS